jgi:hypothetical protein
MAEASHSVHQAQIRAMDGAGTAIPPEGTTMNIIHLPTSLSSDEVKFAVIVLAQRAAREAVKRQLQAQGVRVALLPCSEISRRANEYLKAHRSELLAQAALSPLVRNLQNSLNRRAVDPKAKSLNETRVQIGEADPA